MVLDWLGEYQKGKADDDSSVEPEIPDEALKDALDKAKLIADEAINRPLVPSPEQKKEEKK